MIGQIFIVFIDSGSHTAERMRAYGVALLDLCTPSMGMN